jgi:hypothetical protein
MFRDSGHGVGSSFSRNRSHGVGSKFSYDRCDGIGSPKQGGPAYNSTPAHSHRPLTLTSGLRIELDGLGLCEFIGGNQARQLGTGTVYIMPAGARIFANGVEYRFSG